MGKQRKEPSPEDLDPVREQIRAWRETRRLPGPMPSEIWDRAVVLARVFGVCKVARAVGLDYSALRKKVAKAMEKPGWLGGNPARELGRWAKTCGRGNRFERDPKRVSRQRVAKLGGSCGFSRF